MTTTPLGTIQGLASNIQWQDLIDQIMAQEQARTLAPVTIRSRARQTSVGAWQSYQTLVSAVQTSAATLRDTAFDAVKHVGRHHRHPVRPIVSVDGDGRRVARHVQHRSALARDRRQARRRARRRCRRRRCTCPASSGSTVAASTSRDGDSLSTLRDTINALNTGTSATGVSATILSLGSSGNRLVLTAANPARPAFSSPTAAPVVLASLGLVDPAGAVRHDRDRRRAVVPLHATAPRRSARCSARRALPASTNDHRRQYDRLDRSRERLARRHSPEDPDRRREREHLDAVAFNGATMSQLDIGAPVSARSRATRTASASCSCSASRLGARALRR